MTPLTRTIERTAALLSGCALFLLPACVQEPAQQAPGTGLVVLQDEEAPVGPVAADVEPRPYFHDFGHVPDGEVVSHVFRLENTDPGPIAIRRVVPSCGCTVASIRYVRDDGEAVVGRMKPEADEAVLSVPPGVVAELEIQIDTRLIKVKNTDKLLITTVTTDSPASYYLSLETHIFVERPFTVVPDVLNAGGVAVNAGGKASVQIVQTGTFAQRVSGLQEVPEGVHAELTHDDSLGQSVWTVSASFEPPLGLGPRTGVIQVATETVDGKPADPIAVPFVVTGVPDLVCDPTRLILATDRSTEARGEIVFRSLLSGHRFRILEARMPDEHASLLAASFEPIDPDSDGRSGRWKLVLTTKPPLPAGDVLAGELELALDDPQHPSATVPYVIHTR